MFRGWFDCREVDAFADGIVADLVTRVPPAAIENLGKKAAGKLRKTHDWIFRRVQTFARANELNLYKRAHIGNRFKWALKEAGYPADFADALTYELVTVVTLASARGGKTQS